MSDQINAALVSIWGFQKIALTSNVWTVLCIIKTKTLILWNLNEVHLKGLKGQETRISALDQNKSDKSAALHTL